jgi:TetR/AcrR family transcriptional repressor of uid operon
MSSSPGEDPTAAGEEKLDPYSERILDAADEQLLEFGLQRTSLNRIAEAAGVSRGTLFNRFPNRDALLAAVATRDIRRWLAELDAEIATCETPEERLIGGIVAGAHCITRHRLIRRLLETDRDQVLPLLSTEADPLLAIGRAYVAAQIVRAREEGMTITCDPEQLAEVLVRLAHSLLLTPTTVFPLDDDERLAELTRTLILPLLRGCGDP